MEIKRCRCERCNLYWDEEVLGTKGNPIGIGSILGCSTHNDTHGEMYDVRTTMYRQAMQVIAVLILVLIGLSLAIIMLP